MKKNQNKLKDPEKRSSSNVKAAKKPNNEVDSNKLKLVRLNKYIADAGICSRREADKLIANGEIYINGEIASRQGLKVNPSDKVTYKGKLLKGEKLRYVLLNKPKGFISTSDDPHDRKTVMQ